MSEPVALDADLLRSFPLPQLSEDGDKETRGRAFVIAGSRELPGAAILAGTSALRAGAGKLRIATAASVATAIGAAVPEARVIGHAESDDGCIDSAAVASLVELADKAQSITIGCGLQHGAGLDRLLQALLGRGADIPLVLDATILGCLPAMADEVRAWTGGSTLLPHAREMARLLECDADEVERDRLAAARRAADRYRAVALVKGRFSFIAAPDGRAFRFEGGGIGLATSGSGDVLAGVVGGLAARGGDPLTATLWGVWLHGEAGRILTETVGRVGFLAREIADLVPGLLSRSHPGEGRDP
jgi:ADP-dependent NAD(P)H-hydrate dehydratase